MTALLLAAAVALVGSDDYPARESGTRLAHRAITRDPLALGPAVEAAALTDPRPEARSRLARVVPRYRVALAAAYVPRGVPAWPYIDMLGRVTGADGLGPWAEWKTAAGPCPTGSPGKIPQWHEWRWPTEYMARRLVATGWTPGEVDDLLLRMWSAEREYIAREYPQHAAEWSTWTTWTTGYP